MKLAISSPPEDGFVEGAATGIVRQAASSPCSSTSHAFFNVDKRALCKWNNLPVSDLRSIYHLSIGHETCVD